MQINHRTNKLNILFQFQNILDDYSIIKFSTNENYIKYGALMLDEVELKLQAKSIVFESGKSFYALFDKTNVSNIDLANQLQKIQDGDKLSFTFLNETELKKISNHSLAQLLINSISTPNHPLLRFNNLTGKLYLFNSNHLKYSNSKIIKIIGLEICIDSDSCLQLNVKTFSSVLCKNKMDFSKKSFNSYPKYTYVHSTNTLRRILANEKIEIENQYILKQTLKEGALEKNNIPYLDFSDLEAFKNSKIGMLSDVFDIIKEKLSKYLSLEFKEVIIDKTIRYKPSFEYSKLNQCIYLIDKIEDDYSGKYLLNLKEEIEKMIHNQEIIITKKENKSAYNIKLIHNKDFYKKYIIEDRYKSSEHTQHITYEDFRQNSKASIKAIINELLIKKDISENKISIIDWTKYNYKNKWIFGIKYNNAEFCFLNIKVDGTLSFEKFEPDLFNQNEYDELCSLYENDKNIEFIVKDDIGNINIIKQTNSFTIPLYEKIKTTLKKEASPIVITKDIAISLIRDLYNEEKVEEIKNNIEQIDTWNKKNLLSCIKNRNDKKKFVKKVEEETGEILKSYLRDNSRYYILDSQLDIHTYRENEEYYYYVGIKGEEIRKKLSRASLIRKIETYKGSKYIFNKLLPLMNVDFVKNGDLTVYPFPIKYIREWCATRPSNNRK